MAATLEILDSNNDYALQKLTVNWSYPLHWAYRDYYYVGRRVMVIRPDHLVHYPELFEDKIVNEKTLEVDYVAFVNWSKAIYEAFTVPMNEADARAYYKSLTDTLENIYGG